MIANGLAEGVTRAGASVGEVGACRAVVFEGGIFCQARVCGASVSGEVILEFTSAWIRGVVGDVVGGQISRLLGWLVLDLSAAGPSGL